MMKVQQELLLIKKSISDQQFKMKLDSRIGQLQKSLKWFKDEALNLSSIVENKSKQIKDIQGEHILIQNEISLLTQALKNQKKENRVNKLALQKLQELSLELISYLKKHYPKLFRNETVRGKISEIETQISGSKVETEEEPVPMVLKEKDTKSMNGLVNLVFKRNYERPIDSQNVFHQMQVDLDSNDQKLKFDTYLTQLLEQTNNGNFMGETLDSIRSFFNTQLERHKL
jgi:hypothetical protein